MTEALERDPQHSGLSDFRCWKRRHGFSSRARKVWSPLSPSGRSALAFWSRRLLSYLFS